MHAYIHTSYTGIKWQSEATGWFDHTAYIHTHIRTYLQLVAVGDDSPRVPITGVRLPLIETEGYPGITLVVNRIWAGTCMYVYTFVYMFEYIVYLHTGITPPVCVHTPPVFICMYVCTMIIHLFSWTRGQICICMYVCTKSVYVCTYVQNLYMYVRMYKICICMYVCTMIINLS